VKYLVREIYLLTSAPRQIQAAKEEDRARIEIEDQTRDKEIVAVVETTKEDVKTVNF
jgi:hypothetical protein